MVAYRFIFTGFAAVATVVASPSAEDHFFSNLLKRQEPGTPAYNCHDNCGLAITLSRQDGSCENNRFLSAYGNCIQCSGPDNYNIWRYYGGTLTTAGGKCNLPTEPLKGPQPDVPPAGSSGPPGGSSSSAAPSNPQPTSQPPAENPRSSSAQAPEPAPTSGSAVQSSAGATVAPTSGAPQSTGAVPQSSGSAPSASASGSYPSGTGSPTESPVEYPISSAHSSSPPYATTPAITITGTGVPHPTSNGTATYTVSSPPEQSVNAAAGLEVSGMFGAVILGMMYGLGN
ncbi:hypothetical protein BU24DRAFT_451802 [Aaosphaeria arxii CBS 175.79]|uniref:Uncharacterized protein n=1 Tax=Aaosphaeria arxii CBS 175.79 TaxID=1450172 RepID=A0A6A5XNP9_9PLEO|nr:uncharacterized protein BU24DRAFT_451802 [Aaosphaeria arxii CBS 175.79]KAF2014868.1 hypothetical protein BU24DRAFT_451802 [Aaosphaeria arxii CBS 175.79]